MKDLQKKLSFQIPADKLNSLLYIQLTNIRNYDQKTYSTKS